MRGLAAAILPLFRLELHFWNNPWLFPWPGQGAWWVSLLPPMASLAAVVAVWAGLKDAKGTGAPLLFGVLVLAMFFYVKFPGTTRHHGFFPLWLVLVTWVGFEASPKRTLLTGLVAIHAVFGLGGAATAAYLDWRYPFSPGRTMAARAASQCSGVPIVGHPDWAASTVAGYLPQRRFFYPARNGWGTFVVWDLARAEGERLPEAEVLARATAATGGGEFCLVVNRPLGVAGPCTLVAAGAAAIAADEALWLYRCQPHAHPR